MNWPRRPTAAERRRELEADEADRLAHERPNIPPRPDPVYDRCNQSKWGTHRFVFSHSFGALACEFCGRLETASRKDPDVV